MSIWKTRGKSAERVEIVALGAYGGGQKTDLVVGSATHATGAIAVAADIAGGPMLLVLASYEPVVWDLRQMPSRRLRAVLVCGHYHSAVFGLAKAVPVAFSRSGAGDRPSPHAYRGGAALERLDAFVSEAFGRGIDRFEGAYQPAGFHIDGGLVPEPEPEPALPGIRAPVPVTRDPVSPQAAGIAQLIESHAIRTATETDWAHVADALTAASSTGHLAVIRPEQRRGRAAYVVLRAISLPKGMYGAHAATFIVPPGVADPADPGSHNTYYRLADGTCHGPGASG